VDLSLIRKYQQLGCKLGDAAVAAHMETLGVGTLVSENRDFLHEIQGLPFRVLRAEEVIRELEEIA
jgi:predicted nucleic acid-binding protein